ncbi:MAG: hypothetical protein R3F02_18595 [Thiolinea sp.]
MNTCTVDDALDDFLLVEALIGDKERPEGGSVDLALNRLEDFLMGLKQPEPEPLIPACSDCIFMYGRDQTCANAEIDDQDKPKSEPAVCGLRVPFKAEPSGGGL